MRKHLKVGMCALAGLTFCADVLAIAPDPRANRYQAIPDRNAFGLKPPTPPTIIDPPPVSLPKLILTGITTILGNKRALLKAMPTATAPGQAAKEESLILTEGQRQGSVEVLNIDENVGSVRVNNSGTVMTLTFEKDGAKLPNTPPPPTAPPGLPAATNANPLPPATLPTTLPHRGPARTNPKLRSLPTRDLRSFSGLSPAQAEAGSAPASPVVAPTPPSLPQDLTPEEQAIVLELQRQSGALPGSTSPVPQTAVSGALVPTAPAPVLPQ